jgi:hypothetical protein
MRAADGRTAARAGQEGASARAAVRCNLGERCYPGGGRFGERRSQNEHRSANLAAGIEQEERKHSQAFVARIAAIRRGLELSQEEA